MMASDLDRPPFALAGSGAQIDDFAVLLDPTRLDALPEPTVLTNPWPPFSVTYVNHAWVHLCGFSAKEVLGKTCSILQGALTDRTALANLKAACTACKPIKVHLINYRKDGMPFGNELSVRPIRSSTGVVSQLVGTLKTIELSRFHVAASPPRSPSMLQAAPHGCVSSLLSVPEGAVSVPASSQSSLSASPLGPRALTPRGDELAAPFSLGAALVDVGSHPSGATAFSAPPRKSSLRHSPPAGQRRAEVAPASSSKSAPLPNRFSRENTTFRSEAKGIGARRHSEHVRSVVGFSPHLACVLEYDSRAPGLIPKRAHAVLAKPGGRREVVWQQVPLDDVPLIGREQAAAAAAAMVAAGRRVSAAYLPPPGAAARLGERRTSAPPAIGAMPTTGSHSDHKHHHHDHHDHHHHHHHHHRDHHEAHHSHGEHGSEHPGQHTRAHAQPPAEGCEGTIERTDGLAAASAPETAPLERGAPIATSTAAAEARRTLAFGLVAQRLDDDDLLCFRLACRALAAARPGPTSTARSAMASTKARAEWARHALDIEPCTIVGACTRAAARGDLELLRWLRKHEAPCDACACVAAAAEAGHVDVLLWLARKGCAAPASSCACDAAARIGNLGALQAMRANGFPWGTSTCAAAAGGGHLELLAWAHANGCPFDEEACYAAALGGHVAALAWLRKMGGEWTAMTAAFAAGAGQLDTLRYLSLHGCPLDAQATAEAAHGAHVRVLEWLLADRCPVDEDTCRGLASCGELSALKWARECGAPWSDSTTTAAAANGHDHVLRWALDNGCEVATLAVRAAASQEPGASVRVLECLSSHPAVPPDLRADAQAELQRLRPTATSTRSQRQAWIMR